MFKNAFNHNLIDDNLRQLIALPNANGGTINTPYIDLQGHVNTGYVPSFELGVNIPVLTTAQLPNAATMAATIQLSDDPTFATGVTTLATVTATGASAAGSASVEARGRVPAQCPRYARASFVSGGGAADSSAVQGEFAAIF